MNGLCAARFAVLQELRAALKKVQGELAKYSHVNKKALDQFVNFTEQRQELSRRVEEVQQSGGAVGMHKQQCEDNIKLKKLFVPR
jgi:structural maintenance of chromosome 3 (chondroitin sulfate proteoglycan 6)